MEQGDVIFVQKKRRSSLIDRAIQSMVQWATGSPFFHVAYYVGGDTVFEANSFRTAGFASLTEYEQYSVKRLVLPQDVREKIMLRIIREKGKEYGWGEILSLFFRKKFGVNVFYDNPHEYICPELLIKAVYEETGHLILNQTTGDISPADLWQSPYLEAV